MVGLYCVRKTSTMRLVYCYGLVLTAALLMQDTMAWGGRRGGGGGYGARGAWGAAAAAALAPSQVLPPAPAEATTTTEATDTTRVRTTTEVQEEDATTPTLAGPTLLDKATTTVLCQWSCLCWPQQQLQRQRRQRKGQQASSRFSLQHECGNPSTDSDSSGETVVGQK